MAAILVGDKLKCTFVKYRILDFMEVEHIVLKQSLVVGRLQGANVDLPRTISFGVHAMLVFS